MRTRRRGRRSPFGRHGVWILAASLVVLAGVGWWLFGGPQAPEVGASTARPALPSESPAARAPTPSPKRPEPGSETPPTTRSGPRRVALVLDDLGRSLDDLERLHELGVPVTYAVLPFESRTQAVLATLRAEGAEILCHLPLEGRPEANPGPGAIRDEFSPRRIARRTREAVAATPGAVGVNNHMGSKVTADPQAMRAILEVVGKAGLFFLDSRTTAETVAYEEALAAGIPTARRDVFLDVERTPEAVRAQFAELLATADRKGAAIGIGHPHEVTLEVLAEEIPRAVAAGYEFVPVSYLLDREGAPAE